MKKDLKEFFYPSSIAVIGASSKKNTLGWELMHNLIRFGYSGKIFPVNPKADSVHSIKSYKSILDIKDKIDLAIIMVAKQFVLQTIDECHKKKIKSVIVITAGFKEMGEEGVTLENELVRKIKNYNMKLVGPNCMGIINTRNDIMMNGTFVKGEPLNGGIGFVSQSGALGAAVLKIIKQNDIGFSQFLSIGNKADISENDVLEYWYENDDVKVITAYLESFTDAKELLRIGKKVSMKKPVIAIKAAKTSAGMKAASSHTGALASADTVAEALFEQSGIIRVNNVEEMFNLAKAFDRAKLPSGKRIGILTNAGGPAILTVDEADKCGLLIPELEESTKNKLKKIVVPEASVNNPVDLLPPATAEVYGKAAEIILSDPNVDAGILILGPPLMLDTVEIGKAICSAAKSSGKSCIVVLMSQDDIIRELSDEMPEHPPIFNNPEKAAWALSEMYKYKCRIDEFSDKTVDFKVEKNKAKNIILSLKKSVNEYYLDFDKVYDLLKAYKFPVINTKIARDVQQSIFYANEIGYPVVLKAFGKELIHKSDVGGVVLGIEDDEELVQIENRVIAGLKEKGLDRKLEGFIIQPYFKIKNGVETILGSFKDSKAGNLIMFGLGGIFVEVFKDVVFKLAPLSVYDVNQMIKSVKSYEILKGIRGNPGVQINYIEENLMRLSKLVTDFPEITEIDLNPFVFSSELNKCVILDARIKINPKK